MALQRFSSSGQEACSRDGFPSRILTANAQAQSSARDPDPVV